MSFEAWPNTFYKFLSLLNVSPQIQGPHHGDKIVFDIISWEFIKKRLLEYLTTLNSWPPCEEKLLVSNQSNCPNCSEFLFFCNIFSGFVLFWHAVSLCHCPIATKSLIIIFYCILVCSLGFLKFNIAKESF